MRLKEGVDLFNIEEIRSKIRSSMEIVKDFEDPYKLEAFKVILLYLLNSTTDRPAKRNVPGAASVPKERKHRRVTKKTTLRSEITQILMRIEDDRCQMINRLKGKMRYFLLLKIAKDKGIDGLSPTEIEYILKERFMLEGIHETNIRRDLRKSKGFVEKTPLGKGHAFRIIKEGEEYLSNQIEKLATGKEDSISTPSN